MTDADRPGGKKRKALPREHMPEQDAGMRVGNFGEVALGYTEEQAIREAGRCLQCKKPACIEGCPVDVDIPRFIAAVRDRDFTGAARIIKERNSLPAIAGRVCPQEAQCEARCVLGKKGEPCAIGRLERFAADREREAGAVALPAVRPGRGKRVAVVGSGPAGLSLAGELIKNGVAVTVFEALHEFGGVLVYGIPEFRLPKDIVRSEVDYLRRLGVAFQRNFVVGQAATVDGLLRDAFDAVFIGTGAGAPVFLNVPGENLCGVYSANEYLTRSNLMKAYRFPQYVTPTVRGRKVAVIGGGNVALDSARTALRLEAEQVTILYRRARAEMPARAEEIFHAQAEGAKLVFLCMPLAFLGSDAGWVRAVRCNRMRLGAPDESGRQSPIAIEGDTFELEIDTAIVAIGNRSNPLVPSSTPGLETNRRGNIVACPDTGRTSREGVWAGGDIVTGAATVIQAMGAGRRAALDMLRHFGIASEEKRAGAA